MIDYKTIGIRIKAARKKSGMTQEKLAELLKVTPEHMSRLETGSANIGLETIDKISEILLTDLESILFGVATTSPYYLNKELSECLSKCPPQSVDAIVKVARIISKL